jgi:hypothetical protein
MFMNTYSILHRIISNILNHILLHTIAYGNYNVNVDFIIK